MRLSRFGAGAALALVACTGSASGPTGIETERNMDATLPSGSWSATRTLRVTTPNGDLVIEGEDANDRKVVLHVNAEALLASGSGINLTISMTPATSPIAGFAQLTEDLVTEEFTGTATWSTAAGSGTGTVTFTERTADRLIGTFSFIGHAPPASPFPMTRSVTNGTFNIRLR